MKRPRGSRRGVAVPDDGPALACPFPATAVAVLQDPRGEFWSVETEALAQARAILRGYLSAARSLDGSREGDGLIVAIVGDYGTGKTHIAQEMLRLIYAEENPLLHPLYLDAPSDTFLALYRERFIPKLNLASVEARVSEYFSDVIAEELEKSQLTAPVASALRERRVEPLSVVSELGLMESALTDRLARRLQDVTSQPDFAAALVLLTRPSFRQMVWEWLGGGAPDAALRERGVSRTIDDDASALEAIGVFAFLFGQQKHRFILFVDEIEKLISQSRQLKPSAILALKKLMEAMSTTRALLVLVGLPEFQEALPRDAVQRIAAMIRPSRISARDVEKYIREANFRATGKRELSPFNTDVVAYLADIAGGNARRIVRLCYLAYVSSESSGAPVTEAMLRAITREQFENREPADVSAEIVRIVESHGWEFKREWPHTLSPEERPDFFVTVGELAGISIFVSRSILQQDDAERVSKVATAIKAASKEVSSEDELFGDASGESRSVVGTVLVVNGYVADHLRAMLDQAFDRVVSSSARDFASGLDTILTGLRTRLENQLREDTLVVVRSRVDEIARQNSHLGRQLDEMASSTIGRADLRSAVSGGIRAVFGEIAGGRRTESAEFPHVADVFERMRVLLDRLPQFDSVLEAIVGISPRVQALSHPEREEYLRWRLSRVEDMDGLVRQIVSFPDLVSIVRRECESFEKGVVFLLRLRMTARNDDPEDSIEFLCRTFDRLCYSTNIGSAVDEYGHLISRLRDAWVRAPFADDWRTAFSPEQARSLFIDVERQLRGMGRDVYSAVGRELSIVRNR